MWESLSDTHRSAQQALPLLLSLPPVQLRDGSVLMGLHRGEDSTLSRLEEVLVNDGEWHHLQLDISSLGRALSHHKAVLSLDQGLYLVGFLSPRRGTVLRRDVRVLFKRPAAAALSGYDGGGREAARVQAEDGERGRSGGA